MYYTYDWTYILVLIGVVITLIAQWKLRSAYTRGSQIESMSGLTGAEAAAHILEANGLKGVAVEPVSGSLTDHYDPRTRVVNLSEDVYNRTDIAALGIAAHECGHALQDAEGYLPLKIRGILVPVASFGARFSWLLIIAGVILANLNTPLIDIGITLFGITVVLEILTLPVERNASNRALEQLSELGMITAQEQSEAKKVLRAAALTYVAAAATGILQLLRLILIFGNRRNSDS